eukprot:6195560-Karenia_brevis.AAC.1
MNQPEVNFVRLDYCQYGTPWRKPTAFLTWHFPLFNQTGRRCHGQRGICSRTHQAHEILQGLGPDGKFKTLIAQPYPKQLCSAYAKAAVSQLRSWEMIGNGRAA